MLWLLSKFTQNIEKIECIPVYLSQYYTYYNWWCVYEKLESIRDSYLSSWFKTEYAYNVQLPMNDIFNSIVSWIVVFAM